MRSSPSLLLLLFPSLSFLFLSLFSSPLSFSLFFPFPFSRGVWRFSRPVPFWDWFGAASTRGPFPSSGKGLQASCSLRFSSFFPFFLFFFCFLLLFLLFVFSRRKKHFKSTCELMWLRPWQRRASAKVRVCDPVLPSCSSSPFLFSFLSLFSSSLSFPSFFFFSCGVWRFSRPVPFWDWFGAASTRGPFPSFG